MSSGAASPRVLFLADVVAAHAGALLVLLAETRTRLVRGETEASPLLVMLFEPRAQAPTVSAGRAASLPASRYRPPAAAAIDVPAPAMPATAGAPIDWAGEASAAAARRIEADEQGTRQARALAPKPSSMFAARPKRHEFPWDYANTHQVEPLGGLATAVRLNDQCAIVLFVIIPFAGGCALEKPPVRGDLFEHMHDPDPASEP